LQKKRNRIGICKKLYAIRIDNKFILTQNKLQLID
jgi:hypothetical protein